MAEIATALHQLGSICIDLGKYDEASGYLEDSLQRSIEMGHKREVALTKGALGRLAKAKGSVSEAMRLWSESLAELDAIGAPQASIVRNWIRELSG